MRLTFRDLRVRAAALLAAGSAAAACNTDSVLQVRAPDVVEPGALTDTLSLPVFLAGAVGDFQVAYNGNNDLNQITAAGLFTDEFIQTESFPTRFQVDTREILRDNGSMDQLFLDLQRARASAERASGRYVASGLPNASGRMDALNIAGYSYILFGENYCSGVPYSRVTEGFTLEYGAAQTTEQTLQAAVAKFDTVLATTTATAAQQNAARVGRARALLNLGQFAQAGTAATGVPLAFSFQLQHSENTGRQNNGTWNLTTNQGRMGVSNNEGGNGLPFITAQDARVPNRPRSTNNGNGFDGGPMREQLKYPTRISSVTVADGVEAQLIRAEAAMRAGDAATFLTLLNEMRSNAALVTARGGTGTLPALTDPGSDVERQNLLFRERAFWLYATSHRLGDMRRLVRQYGRSVASVFPSGNYASNGRTGAYGTDVNFPIPIAEGNNTAAPSAASGADPALKGCLSRGA
ncbi:MAG TPA: hypothetical protein VEZ47_05105 [Gemmatirosa sp.]|jgi:hypothetical protein|nr:hypothetical protein [Gemmatirosa sp.]